MHGIIQFYNFIKAHTALIEIIVSFPDLIYYALSILDKIYFVALSSSMFNETIVFVIFDGDSIS